jgi:regulation of enolase protein 1 (concanavalin A-like superfamily)
MSATASAQTTALGAFTNSDDIGTPPLKGSAQFDAATGEYRITGTGSDIWGTADQFHYVWREMSGDFVISATTRFLTDGNPHRKAVIMLRKSLDADAPFVQLAIHGDGMPSLQFRTTKADTTNTVDLPVQGPGTWTLKLVRQGTTITVWMAKDGAPLRELGHTLSQIGSPVLLGLGVSSHSQEAVNTALFSNVSVERLPPPPPAAPAPPRFGLFTSLFTNAADIGAPAIKGSTQFDAATGQYRITGSGANIWAKQDQFQFAWREMTGNFTMTATLHFLGEGNAHRKAGLMVRQSADPDAAYADVVIHGNGMPALQWRSRKGEDTNAFDLPIEGPGTFTVKLVRTGVRIYMFLAKEGATSKEIAHTEVSLQNPIVIGLAVCSHDAAASDTVVFSNVSIEPQAPTAPAAP